MIPTVPYELHSGILEHLTPQPQTIAHASSVCKAWRRIVNAPDFLNRCHVRHGAPLTMGFFHNSSVTPRSFVHISDPIGVSFDCSDDNNHLWKFMDCHHGRVLLRDGPWFLVLHPITGYRHLFNLEGSHLEEYIERSSNAALLCSTAEGDDHNICCREPMSPFRVVLVQSDSLGRMHANVYSSLSRKWIIELTPPDIPLQCHIRAEPCVVIFNTMYQPLYDYRVLAYDMDKCTSTVFERPRGGNVRLMKADGGVRLGLAAAKDFTLRLWARGAYGGWVLRAKVNLGELIVGLTKAPLPKTDPCFLVMPPVMVIGVAEEGDALFLWTMIGVFMFSPKTMEIKKVHEIAEDMEIVYPYTTFFIPTTYAAIDQHVMC